MYMFYIQVKWIKINLAMPDKPIMRNTQALKLIGAIAILCTFDTLQWIYGIDSDKIAIIT